MRDIYIGRHEKYIYRVVFEEILPRDNSFYSMIKKYNFSNGHNCALLTRCRGCSDCAIFKISGQLDIDIWSYGPLTCQD